MFLKFKHLFLIILQIAQKMNIDSRVVIENRLLPTFRRTMTDKYEMSGVYVAKAIRGELPDKKIARKIVTDYQKFKEAIDTLVKTIEN